MSLLTQHPAAPGRSSRDLAGFVLRLHREWAVRREVARAQALGGAALRDIGLASGGIESAVRHGRGPR